MLNRKVRWDEGRIELRGVVVEEYFQKDYDEPDQLLIEVVAIRAMSDPVNRRWGRLARTSVRVWVDFEDVEIARF